MIAVEVLEEIERVWITPVHLLGFYSSYEEAGMAAELFFNIHHHELFPGKKFICQTYNTSSLVHGPRGITHWETDQEGLRTFKKHYGEGWTIIKVSQKDKIASVLPIQNFMKGVEIFKLTGQIPLDFAGLKFRKK